MLHQVVTRVASVYDVPMPKEGERLLSFLSVFGIELGSSYGLHLSACSIALCHSHAFTQRVPRLTSQKVRMSYPY